jgi:hypothetical protein
MMTETSQSFATAPASVGVISGESRRKVRPRRLVLAIAALAGLAALAWCILDNHCNPGGEPFSLNEGISIWPTEIVCAFVVVLSVIFLVRAQDELFENKKTLKNRYSLSEPFEEDDAKQAWRDHLERFRQAHPGHGLKQRIREIGCYLRWIRIRDWECPCASAVSGSDRDAAGKSFSTHYNVLGYGWHRIYRCLPCILAYTMFAVGIWLIGAPPFVPYRGESSLAVDRIVFWSSVVFQTALMFFTVDASYLCRKFIDNLAGLEMLPWSDKTEAVFEKRCGLRVAFTEEYIAAKVIGDRSAAVNRLIFYPFFVLFLTIVSRASFFGHWNWPPSLILIFGINAAIAAYSVWALRRAAEEARKALLERLNSKIRCCMGAKTPDLVKTLQDLAHEIESSEEGAFAPITKQPVIHAVLMPLGAAGLTTVLNYLPKL